VELRMESRLLEILVCPLCKGPLRHDRERQELVCKADKLAYPIRDGIPIMLENEARNIVQDTSTPPLDPAAAQ
jgi:uncharacterized protein YbaR (Trm112 family)